MTLSGREKATIFLSLLGAEAAAKILRYLPNELAQLIASGINQLPSPSPQALSEVIGEFESFLALPSASPPPPMIEATPEPVKPRRSYGFLIYERPQVIAFLLSLLSQKRKEDVLHGMTRDRGVIEELMSSLRKNTLSVKLEAALREKFKERLFD